MSGTIGTQPQPNMTAFASHAEGVIQEVRNLSNIPLIYTAAQLTTMFGDLQTNIQTNMRNILQTNMENINGRFDEVNGRFNQIAQRLYTIDTRLTALETRSARQEAMTHNISARMKNSHAPFTRNRNLVPLRTLADNRGITDFPATVDAIDGYDATRLRAILTSLEEQVEGSDADIRDRLQWAIGIGNRIIDPR
ncbi:MAG: hypothetical protein M1820_005659 [Bogoriella megaspora]|nr:MAG: hypothetical protein M1820_005659 [Bogoriella megaspora]